MKNFIACGVPRSGTTALASLLNWHPNVFCGIERFPLDRADQSYFTPQAVRDPSIPTAHFERNLGIFSGKSELLALGDKGPRYFYRLAGNSGSFSGIKLVIIIRNSADVYQSWNARARNPDDLSWHRGQNGVFSYFDTLQLLHTMQFVENSHDGIVLSYEELFYGEQSVSHEIISRIFRFLGVSTAPEVIEQFDSESGKRLSLQRKTRNLSKDEYNFIELTGAESVTSALAEAGGLVSSKEFARQSKAILTDLGSRKNEILASAEGLLLPDSGISQAMTILSHCYRLSSGNNVFKTLTDNGKSGPLTFVSLATLHDSLYNENYESARIAGEALLDKYPNCLELLDEMTKIYARLGDRSSSRIAKEKAQTLRNQSSRKDVQSLEQSAGGNATEDSPKAPAESAPRTPALAPHDAGQLSRSQIIRRNLDLAGIGLEIGPLHKPVVTKSEGNVRYLDRIDRKGLMEQYRHHANIPVAKIEDLDFVLVDGNLRRTIPEQTKFDYVIASHVIERWPNLLLFLQHLDEVLAPGGIISLAIPDKRYCFDTLRDVSVLAEVLAAYHDDHRRPSFLQVFNHMSKVAKITAPEAWAGQKPEPIHGNTKAYRIAQESQKPGHYHDLHCWTFTPESFSQIIDSLLEMKLIALGISEIVPTRKNTNEFFVQLRRV